MSVDPEDVDHPEPSAPGERLAAWLDDLGLSEHLESAGLPRLDRDQVGAARWVDPQTGAALTAEQLTDLDRMLRQQGSEPEHAVPVPLLQIARQAKVRQHLLTTRCFTYASLARVRHTTTDAARFAVHKAAAEHRLLIVPSEDAVIIPGFQLDPDGEVRAELLAVIEPLLAAGMDAWRAWGWLTQPAALLGGRVPEEVAADPQDHDLVLNAAIRLAERVASS